MRRDKSILVLRKSFFCVCIATFAALEAPALPTLFWSQFSTVSKNKTDVTPFFFTIFQLISELKTPRNWVRL